MGPICLGNISKDWPVDNMKKTGFTGCVYDFSVNFKTIAVDDIKNIYKYLMGKVIQYEYIKQKIINHTYKMGTVKQINTKNRTY